MLDQSHILIIEEDPLEEDLLYQYLEASEEYSPFILRDLENLFESIQKQAFIDLAFLDFSILKKKGKEFLTELQNLSKMQQVPLILTLNQEQSENLENFLDLGKINMDLLVKPFTPILLKAKIQNELKKKKQIRKMIHDLRSPLNGILGFTNLLRQEKECSSKQKAKLDKVYRGGKELLEIMENFSHNGVKSSETSKMSAKIFKTLEEKAQHLSEKTSRGVVLIVDDNLNNLNLLFELLTEAQYQVILAENGKSALQKIETLLPDIILLDIVMPEMDGFEVCRRLKAELKTKEIPILFMTALNETTDKLKGFQVGAVDYITKPYQNTEVLARIKTHLTLCNLKTELQKANEKLEQRVIERTIELQEEIIERKEGEKRLKNLNMAYGRFVPHDFLRLLQKESITDLTLGDNIEMKMTILFSDIRSFTTLSEEMTPGENFQFLNAYLEKMGPIVRRHNGFIDKFIGDAIMALFDRGADHAVQSAIQMLKILDEYNQERKNKGFFPIQIGIGINTGQMMLGTIGEQDRMEGTVISDAVNLASRLEGLTKIYGTPLLIGEESYTNLATPEKYTTRLIDRVLVKGKKKAIDIYEIINADSPEKQTRKLESLEIFEKAYQFYQRKEFLGAQESFQKCLKVNPKDKASQVYIDRCKHLIKVGSGKDWEGVTRLDTKQLFIFSNQEKQEIKNSKKR